MTFFYREMPGLVESGRLFIAQPPLYRLTQGANTLYARDDAHKDELLESGFTGRGKIDVSRFKGLGEMPPAQLKETTMDPGKRTLLQVQLPRRSDPEQATDARDTAKFVEALMGRKPESRFNYIQKNARFVTELDV
jgi:topoisomerase-4 subunit B